MWERRACGILGKENEKTRLPEQFIQLIALWSQPLRPARKDEAKCTRGNTLIILVGQIWLCGLQFFTSFLQNWHLLKDANISGVGFFPPQTKLSGAWGQGKKCHQDIVSLVQFVSLSANGEASQDSRVSWPVTKSSCECPRETYRKQL